MIPRSATTRHDAWPVLARARSLPQRWTEATVRVVWAGAVLLALALSPSTWRDARTRHALARHVWFDTAPVLLGFSLLAALLTLVITRIVIVTAGSYGLSQYALEMVIRVLVLELIPLTAALFVALRCTLPNGAALAQLLHEGHFDALRREGRDPVQAEAVPRLVAGIFCTITLAALSAVVATLLAYLAVYGPTAAGLPAYTRMFGRVFNSTVSLILLLKVGFSSVAVAVLPLAAGLHVAHGRVSREGAALRGLVTLFAVLLALEAASLLGNYY